jgi:hypothetical protein
VKYDQFISWMDLISLAVVFWTRVKIIGGPSTCTNVLSDPKLRIFNIWVHKLARLWHLGPKLMIYGICIPKLAKMSSRSRTQKILLKKV